MTAREVFLDSCKSAYKLVKIEGEETDEQAVAAALQRLRSSIGLMLKTNPVLRPVSVNQDVGTPDDLVCVLQYLLGFISYDLAGSAVNHVHPRYLTPEDDSLNPETKWPKFKRVWKECPSQPHLILKHWLFLNPPYGNLRGDPWLERCVYEMGRGRDIITVIPHSAGARWWKQWVEPYASVMPLEGRPKFKGYTNSNARDIAIAIYSEEWTLKKALANMSRGEKGDYAENIGLSRQAAYTQGAGYIGAWDWRKALEYFVGQFG